MDYTLILILISTFIMSLISWVGLILFFIGENMLNRLLRPLIAFSAGTLFAGALLHLVPEAIQELRNSLTVFSLIIVGFTVFFFLEQLLTWYRTQHFQTAGYEQEYESDEVYPEMKTAVTYLILIADGVHNFIGGLAIAGSFLISYEVGVITWIAAAAHEIPQEFGDFGILVHGGWKRVNALIFNFFSALTIVPGGVIAFLIAEKIETAFLLPFAAGNFIYIAAVDLLPEITQTENHEGIEERVALRTSLGYFLCFSIGLLFIWGTRVIFMS